MRTCGDCAFFERFNPASAMGSCLLDEAAMAIDSHYGANTPATTCQQFAPVCARCRKTQASFVVDGVDLCYDCATGGEQ